MSSAVGLKTCAIIAGIKKYKSIVKRKKKKHYKILFLVKSKLNRAEQILVMVDLFYKQYARRICSNERINKKFKDLIKFIKDFGLFIKQCYCIVWSAEKIQKVKIQKLQGQ